MVISRTQDLYIGPRSFETKDKDIFFGREREANELLSLSMAYPILLVYSQSGAGKTSLINARLKPDLEDHGFEVLNIVRLQVPLPEESKLETVDNIFIFKTLLNLDGGNHSFEKQTLSAYLKNRPSKTDDDGFPIPRVIIFDQFEELFTLHGDRWHDRKKFFVQIREAILQSKNGTEAPLAVIFSMREDYIAYLDEYAREFPGKLSSRYRLELLREGEALSAITGPLKYGGIAFEPGVAEALVDQLLQARMETDRGERIQIKGEYVEPVQLQLVCQNLLENLPEHVNTISQHHVNIYGNLDETLSEFYDNVIRETSRAAFVDEAILRDWFGKVLITSTGTRGTIDRGPESTGGIPNDAVDILERQHIIRGEYRASARWYELTHDRFIEPIKASNKTFKSRATGQYEVEETHDQALYCFTQGERFRDSGNYDQALQEFNRAQELYAKIGDQRGLANTLTNIGDIHFKSDGFENAIKSYEDALVSFRLANDKWGSVSILAKLARIYDHLYDLDRSAQYRDDAIYEMLQVPGQARPLYEKLRKEDPSFEGYEQKFEELQQKFLSHFDQAVLTSHVRMHAAYDDVMAWLLASLCQLVYDRFDEGTITRDLFEAKLVSGGFSLVETFISPETASQAFLVVKRDSFAILVFGALPSERKALTMDFRVKKVSVPAGRVAVGYYDAYKSLEAPIMESIRKIGRLPLYITGHSSGAGMATIATQYFEKDSSQVAACYTFGSPRVASGNFEYFIKAPIYRVVNRTDVVTAMPLTAIGYIHVGDVRYLGRDGEISRSIPTLRRSLLFLITMFRFFVPIVFDHAISEYKRKLEIIAKRRNPELFESPSGKV